MAQVRGAVCLLVVVALAAAGGTAQQRTFRDLVASVPMTPPGPARAADAPPATELVISWQRPSAGAPLMVAGDPSPLDRFELTSTRPASSGPSRERRPELSPDHLVVVFRDGLGIERGWQIVTDPRILRAEAPSPTGELRGQTLYRAAAELVVTAPGGFIVASLEILQPRWNGADFLLDSMGRVVVVR